MKKIKLLTLVLAAIATVASGVYAYEDEVPIDEGGDIKAAWKDSNGFCPAGCDAGKYDCPCVIITAE